MFIKPLDYSKHCVYYLPHTQTKKPLAFDGQGLLPNGEVIMSHKKPQRLLTIEQISNRWFWSKVQDFFLALVIFGAIGGAAYAAFYQG